MNTKVTLPTINIISPSITISRETQRRLVSDIKDLIITPLVNDGIYYVHDEDDMLKGYALIIGPEDTIYEDGFYLFKFDIPYNYPFAPPKVTFCTQGDNVRFNPNLYRNGKVCISILNTWKGEQWTSCQTLRSILLMLVTLLHNKPLLNEPGLTETYKDYKSYNQIIEFKNYDVALLKMLLQQNFPPIFTPFCIFMKKNFLTKYENIIKRLNKKIEEFPEVFFATANIYNMRKVVIDYKKIKKEIENLHSQLGGRSPPNPFRGLCPPNPPQEASAPNPSQEASAPDSLLV